MEFTILYTEADAKEVLKQIGGDTKYLEGLVLEVFTKYYQKKTGKGTNNYKYTSSSLNYANGRNALPKIEELVEKIVEEGD